MKLAKSILLGAAAGLATVAAASAADLPSRKSAPVEYVKVCNAYGAGFFYIPGTDTCLRVGGLVVAEARAQWPSKPTVRPNATVSTQRFNRDRYGSSALGRLELDARTQTGYGTLRAFARIDAGYGTAWTAATGSLGALTVAAGNSATNATAARDTTTVNKAFIQFAGITAGRAQSMFDFYADAFNWELLRGSNATTNLLAYTATFGGGFSATLSLEDPSARSWGVKGVATTTGAKYLDVIGALRVDQGWGSAQLSGAFGRRTTYLSAAAGALHKDYDIWAIQGGVKINLPMLAAGDTLYLQAAYAKGASGYLGGLPGVRNGFQGTYADALSYATPTGYSVAINKGWVATAAFQHYWTPSFRSVLMGSYLSVDYGSVMKAAGYYKGTEWRVGGMMIWSPVKELDIGLELLYAKVNNKVSAPTAAAIAAAGLKRNPDSIEARVRFQRSF